MKLNQYKITTKDINAHLTHLLPKTDIQCSSGFLYVRNNTPYDAHLTIVINDTSIPLLGETIKSISDTVIFIDPRYYGANVTLATTVELSVMSFILTTESG